MDQTPREQVPSPQGGGAATPLLSRPWVLLALLALVIGALVWAFTRTGGPGGGNEEEPSADELALRRAAASGKLMQFTSEAQRLYRRGLGQCREGDVVGARRTWNDLVTVFHDVEAERRWVDLAESGLDLLKNCEQSTEERGAAVRQTLLRVKDLQGAGKAEDAQRLRAALDGLYRDDPAVGELLGVTSPQRQQGN